MTASRYSGRLDKHKYWKLNFHLVTYEKSDLERSDTVTVEKLKVIPKLQLTLERNVSLFI